MSKEGGARADMGAPQRKAATSCWMVFVTDAGGESEMKCTQTDQPARLIANGSTVHGSHLVYPYRRKDDTSR